MLTHCSEMQHYLGISVLQKRSLSDSDWLFCSCWCFFLFFVFLISFFWHSDCPYYPFYAASDSATAPLVSLLSGFLVERICSPSQCLSFWHGSVPGSACICCFSVAVLIACGNYECLGERLERGVEKHVVAYTLFHPLQILITGLYVSTHTTKETNGACQYSPCVHTLTFCKGSVCVWLTVRHHVVGQPRLRRRWLINGLARVRVRCQGQSRQHEPRWVCVASGGIHPVLSLSVLPCGFVGFF